MPRLVSNVFLSFRVLSYFQLTYEIDFFWGWGGGMSKNFGQFDCFLHACLFVCVNTREHDHS